MMKRPLQILLLISVLCGSVSQVHSQTQKQHQIALFVPLYLDSAYDATDNYRYGKTFPKQSIAGLEFYMGAESALDSLASIGQSYKLHVFDTRSNSGNINSVALQPLMDSIELIIGPVTGTDYLQLASLAQQKNIPFISATYPNDGGIKNNPNVVIVNAKLNTHIQAIYNYVLRNMTGNRIIYLRRKNPADDRVAEVFKSLNQSTTGSILKMETVILPDFFTVQDLASKLDSTKDNLIITGSLDENFGRNVAVSALGISKTYPMTLVGMPTWESIKDLSKPDFKTLPVIYTTTFFNNTTDQWIAGYDSAFRKKTFSKPSVMAFRGYEITWLFSQLLNKYDTLLMQHLDDKEFNLATDYDFRPIHWNKDSTIPDYYENKRVFIIRRLNGVLTRLN
jgi:ABC-type branched-subunit amino acid transport system substrate-binding protein